MIKAIDTFYNEKYFRSRLEARWAVYFDELKIRYIYEPEGYELSNGYRYLPDFYLPDHNLYVEVKLISYDGADFAKHKCFVEDKKTTLVLAVGEPDPVDMEILWYNYSGEFEVTFGTIMPIESKYYRVHWNTCTDCFKEINYIGMATAAIIAKTKRFEK